MTCPFPFQKRPNQSKTIALKKSPSLEGGIPSNHVHAVTVQFYRGRCVRGCLIALSPSSLFFQSCNRPGDAGRGHSNVPRYLRHR